MTTEITNYEDIIDSRDIIARIDDLKELEELDQDQTTELASLKKLAEQCEGYGDWAYGETLIRGSYFREYAQQLAEDCGSIPDNLPWPLTCIDWEQAARELKYDYMSVDFDGVEYYMRA